MMYVVETTSDKKMTQVQKNDATPVKKKKKMTQVEKNDASKKWRNSKHDTSQKKWRDFLNNWTI